MYETILYCIYSIVYIYMYMTSTDIYTYIYMCVVHIIYIYMYISIFTVKDSGTYSSCIQSQSLYPSSAIDQLLSAIFISN